MFEGNEIYYLMLGLILGSVAMAVWGSPPEAKPQNAQCIIVYEDYSIDTCKEYLDKNPEKVIPTPNPLLEAPSHTINLN